MDYYLGFGFVLGLAAGLAPGPLLTLVVTETLQHGVRAGIRVALAPIITDLPIVIVMLVAVDQLSGSQHFIGLLSLAGGCYVLFMAWETAGLTEPPEPGSQTTARSLTKGVVTNLLNPHPYLFWLAVGAPLIIQSTGVSAIAPVLFITGFYLPLLGSKVLLALVIGRYAALLNSAAYRNLMRFLALLLVIFAAMLFIDGLELLGIYVSEPVAGDAT